jgi:hypothetical protein
MLPYSLEGEAAVMRQKEDQMERQKTEVEAVEAAGRPKMLMPHRSACWVHWMSSQRVVACDLNDRWVQGRRMNW